MWLDGLSDYQQDTGTTGTNEAIEAARSPYCAQQLTADDYAATFLVASGEFPGLILMWIIIDRIGRRGTIGLVRHLGKLYFVEIVGTDLVRH